MPGYLVQYGVDCRVELYNKAGVDDVRAKHVHGELSPLLRGGVRSIQRREVYTIRNAGPLSAGMLSELLADPVTQEAEIITRPQDVSVAPGGVTVEIAYRAGVTDPVAITLRSALARWAPEAITSETELATAVQYRLYFDEAPAEDELRRAAAALYNPLIERATIILPARAGSGGTAAVSSAAAGDAGAAAAGNRPARPPFTYETHLPASEVAVEQIDVAAASDAELAALSERRLLALTQQELSAIRAYYADPAVGAERRRAGLAATATDCELEMIAQTWSEHCKHKIFQARIRYSDEDGTELIDGLFNSYIRATTARVAARRSDLRSVFHDNSGVIDFDDDYVLCFKAETHNSPSALDPYGGAITGIVGVNRDIIGTGKGAKPIFNTDVLCFGPLGTPAEELPAGFLHPRRILSGVHRGIVDGGNQSGIPTVAGAVLFDESYVGKPLVFCGTGGLMPRELRGEASWINHVDPGDKAVMVGGRIGKDGIHGATFSSLALDESSPTSAVQIGDPITQRRMLDLLLEARDKGLFKGITDNGAGGLSSSLGEMAELSGGVRIELERCPLKYPGLAPWEILLSESQERMSLAVAPETLETFLELAAEREVEATVVGEFTASGSVELFFDGAPVGLLSLAFLHDGLPRMELEARWEPPAARREPVSLPPEWDEPERLAAALQAILSDHTVASKEFLVRQYDHEVQARTAGKPFCGSRGRGPADGAVITPRYDSPRAVTVTHGICPRYGDYDSYHMAMCAVDEALRAHVALGGDPVAAAALDNFCWPDPVTSEQTPDGAYKLAQLVRACRGLAEACSAYGIPLISGKDSMKNDARMGGRKVSVRPTLLVSLTGIVPDARRSPSSAFEQAGDSVYVLGETRAELAGSRFELYAGAPLETAPLPEPQRSAALYRALFQAISGGLVRSVHDLADGGLAVALAESAIGGELGCDVEIGPLPVAGAAGSKASGAATAAEASTAPAAGSARAPGGLRAHELLFSETPGRFLVTVAQEQAPAFERAMSALPVARIGVVSADQRVRVRLNEEVLIDEELAALDAAWQALTRTLAGEEERWSGGNDIAAPWDGRGEP